MDSLEKYLLPFLYRCDKDDKNQSQALLQEYVLYMAKTNLDHCLEIFKTSKTQVRFTKVQSKTYVGMDVNYSRDNF